MIIYIQANIMMRRGDLIPHNIFQPIAYSWQGGVGGGGGLNAPSGSKQPLNLHTQYSMNSIIYTSKYQTLRINLKMTLIISQSVL